MRTQRLAFSQPQQELVILEREQLKELKVLSYRRYYNYLKFTTKKEEIIINNLIYPDLPSLAAKFANVKLNHHLSVFAKP